jgi:hypothetical protein
MNINISDIFEADDATDFATSEASELDTNQTYEGDNDTEDINGADSKQDGDDQDGEYDVDNDHYGYNNEDYLENEYKADQDDDDQEQEEITPDMVAQVQDNGDDASDTAPDVTDYSATINILDEDGEEIEVVLTAEDIEYAALNKHHNLSNQMQTIIAAQKPIVEGYEKSQWAQWTNQMAQQGYTDEQIVAAIADHFAKHNVLPNTQDDVADEDAYLTADEKRIRDLEKNQLQLQQEIEARKAQEKAELEAVAYTKKQKALTDQNISLINGLLVKEFGYAEGQDLTADELNLLKQSFIQFYSKTDANGKPVLDKNGELAFYGIKEKAYTKKELKGLLNYAFNILPKKAPDTKPQSKQAPKPTTAPKPNVKAEIRQAKVPRISGNIPTAQSGSNIQPKNLQSTHNSFNRKELINELYKF